MTTYLTKTENGKTLHFKATVENNVVDIVHGVFYNWLGKYAEGCGTAKAALVRQQELIEAKLSEGYQVTSFKESPENTTDVYDKAKWHFSGDFPDGLDDFQGYVHTGMFLGWLVENELISDEFRKDNAGEIEAFHKKEMTGAQLFEACCDGVLTLEDLSETGNRFALFYFNFEKGKYYADYEAVLLKDLPTLYHVVDTWDNYEILRSVLDKRYAAWKNPNSKKPFWKIW